MPPGDPLSRPVDAVAAKTGLTRDAVAILFIVAGVLILVWEDLLQVILGILLIVVGVVWLVTAGARGRGNRLPDEGDRCCGDRTTRG